MLPIDSKSAAPREESGATPASKNALVRSGILAGNRAFTGPYGIQLGIEGACNYSCLFCAEFSPLRPSPRVPLPHGGHMPERVFNAIVDSAARIGVEQISVVGIGEPFLHPHVAACFARVKEAGIRLMVTTNGSALTDDHAWRLLDCGLDILNVSFSAGTERTYGAVHGSRHVRQFATVLERLRRIAAEKRRRRSATPKLVLRFTVIRDNVAELGEWVELAIESGADELIIQNFVPPGFGHDLAPSAEEKAAAARVLRSYQARLAGEGVASNFAYIIPLFEGTGGHSGTFEGFPCGDDFYRQYPCLVGWTYAMIVESGDVMPCCYCGTPMGNVYEQSLEDIWYGETYNAFRGRTRSLPEHGVEEPGCLCFRGCGTVKDNIRNLQRLGLEETIRPWQGEST